MTIHLYNINKAHFLENSSEITKNCKKRAGHPSPQLKLRSFASSIINISSVHKTRDHYQKRIWKSLKKITKKTTKKTTNWVTNYNISSKVAIICPIYRTVFETCLCNTIYASYRRFSHSMTNPSNDMF